MYISAIRRKVRLLATALAAVVPLVVLAGPPAANAATTYSKSYFFEWVFYSPNTSTKLNRCLITEEYGTVTWQNSNTGRLYNWTHITVHNPTLVVDVYNYALAGATKCEYSETLEKMDLQQDWAGYACSFNPSISANYPWGVGISGWPSCGNRNQAGRVTTPDGYKTEYAQSNSGFTFTFQNYSSSPVSDPCYGSYPSITGYLPGKSDTFVGNPAQQVCLPFQ